ncbi:MAG: hypothetical protein MI739_03220 [Bacteroidales bacterium]|nr:hypothetical protein [Bacteroidales bacterium]
MEKASGAPYVKTYYDKLGREIKTETQSFKGIILSTTEYNDKGQIIKTIAPYNNAYTSQHVTRYTYDKYGRKKTISNNGLTTTMDYMGKKLKVTYPSGKVKETICDDAGNTTQVINNKIAINYNYLSNGQLKNTSTLGSSINLTYDANGYQDKLNDPDAGTYDFNYNALGQLKSKKTPLGNYSATYDLMGRVKTVNDFGNNIRYEYITEGSGINQVDKISDNEGEYQNFDYDKYGRIINLTERVGDRKMQMSYGYDEYGRVQTVNYPDNFGIINIYNQTGDLIEIRNNKNEMIWKLLDVDNFGNITQYKNGNELRTNFVYDDKNLLKSISFGSNFNRTTLSYNFNAQKGVLESRTGMINSNTTENFSYDENNQLTQVRVNNWAGLNVSVNYSDRSPGSIESKTGIGDFQYARHRHAVLSITKSPQYNPENQSITYTKFGKVATFEQGDYNYQFTYGPDHKRKLMTVIYRGKVKRKVYYFGSFERHEEDNKIFNLYYIYSPSGLTAIYKKNESGEGNMYYIHTDHLGSISMVTDNKQQLAASYYYNAWGIKFSNDLNGARKFVKNPLPWLRRGFTGHEHLDQEGLIGSKYLGNVGMINMNGRFYDPELGMFISPDPYVQAPDLPINFNRYAYCLNNPLMYTDPDGEFFWFAFAIGAIIGGFTGYKIATSKGYDLGNWQTYAYMFGGAAIGGFSGALGAGIEAAAGVMANTAAIVFSSYSYSVAMSALSGGMMKPSVSFGFGSYDFGTGALNYLFDGDNKWFEDLGYTFGALANLPDVVSLFSGGGQNVDVNSASTKNGDDWWGHSSITDESENTLVSVGPDSPVSKSSSLSATWKNSIKGANVKWSSYVGKKGTWTIKLNNVSTNAINNYASRITRWDLLFNSCVGHTTRALMRAGVPTIYAFHPHMLNLQLAIRQIGIYSSPYLYQIPE